MADDYKYDVFFSYKRDDLTLNWTREVFSRLKLWLTEELNRKAELFLDESSIDIGETWPNKAGGSVLTLGWPTVCAFVYCKRWVTLLLHSTD